MPFISIPTLLRREFLKTGLTAAGAMSAILHSTVSQAQETPSSAHWAFLSDIHIPEDTTNVYRGFHPYEQLQKTVPQIVETSPDGVVISGDLARLEGFPGDYANLRSLLTPLLDTKPVCLSLGNHDHRANFIKVFSDQPEKKADVKGKHVLVVEAAPVRLLILDSLLYTNQVAGLLGKEQRVWLTEYLQKSDETPTLLVFHHPPGDTDGEMLDSDRMLEIITPHKKVKALIYGHSHVYRYDIKEGIHLINLPAVGYNFSDDEPVGWVDARLTAHSGEFTLRAIGGNTSHDNQTTVLEWRS